MVPARVSQLHLLNGAPEHLGQEYLGDRVEDGPVEDVLTQGHRIGADAVATRLVVEAGVVPDGPAGVV